MHKDNKVQSILATNKCFIIAEVAQAHDGSLGQAFAFIDAAKYAGADAIKFQTHFADEESTSLDQWRVKFSKQDSTRFDYWKRMEFTDNQWSELKSYADEKDIIFMSSPFSNRAVDLLESLDMPAWKIASGELTNYPMIERIMETKKPILISSGMSEIEEVESLVEKIRKEGIPYGIFQCTSAYPTPPEKVGLNMIEFYKNKFACPVGLSDHSGNMFSSLAAVTLGAKLIEIHITFSKVMFGPDTIASITVEEFKTMVQGIRNIESMLDNPVNKQEMANELFNLKGLFNKSIVSNKDLSSGHVLTLDDLAFKKPGIGISAKEYKSLIGKKINKSISYNHFFQMEDLLSL